MNDAAIPDEITVLHSYEYQAMGETCTQSVLLTVTKRPPLSGERGPWINVDEPLEAAVLSVIDYENLDAGGFGWAADGTETTTDGNYFVTVITEDEPEELQTRYAYPTNQPKAMQSAAEHELRKDLRIRTNFQR